MNAKSNAERVRNYRSRRKEAGLPDATQRNHAEFNNAWRKRKARERSFVACDGEGCGTDDKGRQLYMLLRIGDRELFTGTSLTTEQCLDFICDSRSDDILVGFAFGYDTTMILRDLSERQARKLFAPKHFEQGKSRYVWYKDFDIEYLPKNYFRVKRVRIVRGTDGCEQRIPVSGSQRTIYETFGFFQKSFLKAIESFKVGTEEQRCSIAENKARRSDFTSIGPAERAYCAMECELLAELMETLRANCFAAGIVPRTWNGAGKLAAALHGMHDTQKASQLNLLPDGLLDFASQAYYGGRFEITRTGAINQKVYEYDICSAYPAAMRNLPCLLHGGWRHAVHYKPAGGEELYVARVSFSTNKNDDGFSQLGGLPVRTREGHLVWPRIASGTYWNCELQSAQKLGTRFKIHEAWIYEKRCDCHAFGWVEPLYEYRKSIGSQGPGYPIKLGLNSLYGKLAQRKGNGVYCNMIHAGLITAQTRSLLNDAIALAPDKIVMCATDAVYSLVPLALPIGDKLGDWEANELDGLFIVQPGLYWCPAKRKRKSRGLSGSFFETPGRTEDFEQAFSVWQAADEQRLRDGADELCFPSVQVPVPGFIGLKLALARNKRELAGTWVKETREISFDYRNKRTLHKWQDGHIITAIKPGSPSLVSLSHRDFIRAGGQEDWEFARELLSEQPDYIDMSAPTWE